MATLVLDDIELQLPPTVDELVTEDGEPLESEWHRAEINLLVDSLRQHWRERSDFYAGGNMFVYYSVEQARRRNYRGPDFFVVLNVDGSYLRKAWVVWEEEGRYPDIIVELLSPSTANADLTTKKSLYERVFRTGDYYCYNPDTRQLLGWTLSGSQYQELTPNERGWLWCGQLGLWLGAWEGEYLESGDVWLRFFDPDGNLVLTLEEAALQQAEDERQRAEAERQQAEVERQRAERAETELARLRARLRELGVNPDESA